MGTQQNIEEQQELKQRQNILETYLDSMKNDETNNNNDNDDGESAPNPLTLTVTKTKWNKMKTSVSRIVKAFALHCLDMLIEIDDIIKDLNVLLEEQHGDYLNDIKTKIVKIENALLMLNELKSFHSFEGDDYAHLN